MHLTSSTSTILLKGVDIKKYLDSLVGEVRVVDFGELTKSAPEGAKKEKEKEKEPAALAHPLSSDVRGS